MVKAYRLSPMCGGKTVCIVYDVAVKVPKQKYLHVIILYVLSHNTKKNPASILYGPKISKIWSLDTKLDTKLKYM